MKATAVNVIIHAQFMVVMAQRVAHPALPLRGTARRAIASVVP